MKDQQPAMSDRDNLFAPFGSIAAHFDKKAQEASERRAANAAANQARAIAKEIPGQPGKDFSELLSAHALAGSSDWIVGSGGTAYYPLAIATADGDEVVAFHAWDVKARAHASAIVLLHNAIPALVRLALAGALAASNAASDPQFGYTRIGALRESFAALPAAAWHLREPQSSYPLAVVSTETPDVLAGRVLIAEFARKDRARAAAEFFVQMHRTMPVLLDAAEAAIKLR